MAFCANANDWYRWRGPEANGISMETGWSANWPDSGPKQLWKAEVGTGFASFAVSQGRVFTMGNTNDTDTVFCFDAASGKVIWHYSYPSKLDPNMYEGGPSATPTVDGDRVYTVSKQGMVHCLEVATGKVVWSKNVAEEVKAKAPRWGFSGSAFVEGDLCILNIGSSGTAVDKHTGKVVWSSEPDEAGYATAVPFANGDEPAVVLVVKREVVALRVKDGKEIWQYPWKTTPDINAADTVVQDKRIFVSSGYNHGAAVFDVTEGSPKTVWQNRNMRNQFNSSVLWEGYLYGFDDNKLRCIAFDTGEVKWTEPSPGKGSLMLADGKLIVLGERGELMVAPASPDGFKPISRTQVLNGKCWTTPVLSNGRIYCRNAAGNIVCLDVGAD